jgi:hypothetical protein
VFENFLFSYFLLKFRDWKDIRIEMCWRFDWAVLFDHPAGKTVGDKVREVLAEDGIHVWKLMFLAIDEPYINNTAQLEDSSPVIVETVRRQSQSTKFVLNNWKCVHSFWKPCRGSRITILVHYKYFAHEFSVTSEKVLLVRALKFVFSF